MLRYLVKDLKNNLSKFIIIFVSLFLTFVSIVTCKAFGVSIIQTRNIQLRNETLNSQILISLEDGGMFDANECTKLIENVENVDKVLERCYIEGELDNNQKILLYAVDIKSLRRIYEVSVVEGNALFNEKDGIICSQKYSKENNLCVGDSLYVNVGKLRGKFIVKAIVKDNEFFQYDNQTVICDINMVNSMLNLNGKVNRIDVTLKDLKSIDQSVEDIENQLKNKKIMVTSKYESSYYDAYVGTIQLALEVFLVFNTVLSLFIIFSTIKSYTIQKIRIIATLRSIGASIRQCKNMILIEVMLVFTIAVIIGSVISVPFIKSLMIYFTGNSGTVVCEIREIMVISIVLLALCIVSAELAIAKVMGLSINGMLKSHENDIDKWNIKVWIVCVVSVIVMLVLLYSMGGDSLGWHYVRAVTVLGGFIVCYQAIIRVISAFISKIFGNTSRVTKLVVQQIGSTLLSMYQPMVIISLVVCVTVVSSMISCGMEISMQSVYKGADVELVGNQTELDTVVRAVQKNKMILNYTVQKRKKQSIDGKQVELSGINAEEYGKESYEAISNGDHLSSFSMLKEKNTIIISSTLARSINKKIGDYIVVGDVGRVKIVALVDTFENKGMVAFLSEELFQATIEEYDYFMILATCEDNQIESVYKEFSDNKQSLCNIYKINTLVKENIENNKLIFNMIYALCVLSLAVSTIALYNSLKINFTTQIRTFIAYRTIGMSKMQMLKKIILEIVIMSTVSSCIGIGMSFLEINVIKTILSYYVGSIKIGINPITISQVVIIVVMTSVMSVLFTVVKCVMSDNCMEEINKY